jgi:hypothetical protein
MTTTAIKHRTHDRLPQVGILAGTKTLANSLAQELGITRPVTLSPKALASARGINLSALVVDEMLWPLNVTICEALLPCLAKERAYIMVMVRVDPKIKRGPWAGV